MLAGQGIIEIDLNRDEITDFLVEIVEIPFQPQFERILAETEFPPAEFRLPNFGDGLVATEVALVCTRSRVRNSDWSGAWTI